MAEPRELPGFYWDPERRKYFRIQKNFAGPGSQHSVENVAKKQHEAKRRKLDEERRQESNATTVQRSRITRSALSNVSLTRESGLLRPSDMRKAQAAAVADMELEDRLVFDEGISCVGFSPLYEARLVASMTGTTHAHIQFHSMETSDPTHRPERPSINVGCLGSAGTSISTSNEGEVLATASISTMHNVLFSGIVSFETITDPSIPVVTARLGSEDTELTASALASGRNGSTNGIVVAKREGYGGEMWLLDVSEGKIVHNPRKFPKQHFLSADWMDTHTAVMGTRSGVVHLWDARSSDGSRRFQHPGAIRQLHSAGDGYGVWAVSMKAIHKYDTRMVNRGDNVSTVPWSKTCACPPHTRKRCGRCSSRAIVEMTEPAARIACDTGNNSRLSVWKELGLVAVSKPGCQIRLYDGMTGEDTGASMVADQPQTTGGLQDSIGGLSTGFDKDGEPYLMYSLSNSIRKYTLGGSMDHGY